MKRFFKWTGMAAGGLGAVVLLALAGAGFKNARHHNMKKSSGFSLLLAQNSK